MPASIVFPNRLNFPNRAVSAWTVVSRQRSMQPNGNRDYTAEGSMSPRRILGCLWVPIISTRKVPQSDLNPDWRSPPSSMVIRSWVGQLYCRPQKIFCTTEEGVNTDRDVMVHSINYGNVFKHQQNVVEGRGQFFPPHPVLAGYAHLYGYTAKVFL